MPYRDALLKIVRAADQFGPSSVALYQAIDDARVLLRSPPPDQTLQDAAPLMLQALEAVLQQNQSTWIIQRQVREAIKAARGIK